MHIGKDYVLSFIQWWFPHQILDYEQKHYEEIVCKQNKLSGWNITTL